MHHYHELWRESAATLPILVLFYFLLRNQQMQRQTLTSTTTSAQNIGKWNAHSEGKQRIPEFHMVSLVVHHEACGCERLSTVLLQLFILIYIYTHIWLFTGESASDIQWALRDTLVMGYQEGYKCSASPYDTIIPQRISIDLEKLLTVLVELALILTARVPA